MDQEKRVVIASVYSLSQKDMEEAITIVNRANRNKRPNIQLACFSAVTNDDSATPVPYCVLDSLIPNNPTFRAWTEALEKIQPFTERVPISVKIVCL